MNKPTMVRLWWLGSTRYKILQKHPVKCNAPWNN